GESVDARAEATVDVVLQAGTGMIAIEVDGARWDEEAFVYEVENAARKSCREIGSEIESAVFFYTTGEVDAGELVGDGEFYVGVGFVVAENDVELGFVFLDEIVFESEGFFGVGDDDGFEVGDFASERAGFGVDGPTGFEEVGADAAAKRD